MDEVSGQELERLLRQLQNHDLEAIGARLGLNLHASDRPGQSLRAALSRDPELRRQAEELALTLTARANCSFCGKPPSRQRKVIASPSGANICSTCLQGFK